MRLRKERNSQISNNESEIEEIEEESDTDIDFNRSEIVATEGCASTSIKDVSIVKKKEKKKKTTKKKKKKKRKTEYQENSDSVTNMNELNDAECDAYDNDNVGLGANEKGKRKRAIQSDTDDEDDLFDIVDDIPTAWKYLINIIDQSKAHHEEHLKLLEGKWFACIYTPPPKNSKRSCYSTVNFWTCDSYIALHGIR